MISPPEPFGDRLRPYYEMAREGHFWIEWRFRVLLLQALRVGLAADRTVEGLDVGCGNGVVRRQAQRYTSWRLDGVDTSPEAVRRCAGEQGTTLLYDVRDRRSELADRYDLAVMFDVLEHVAEPVPLLEAVAHHLRPGGWLFVNVPALPLLFSGYDRAQGHFRRYTRAALLGHLRAVPLELRDLRYWGFSLIPFALLRRLLPDSGRSPDEVLARGFQPPGRLAHHGLLAAMRLETALLRRPPFGTSLMLAAVKPA